MTKMTETRDRGIGAPGVTKSGRSIGILAVALLCAGCSGGTPPPADPAPAAPPRRSFSRRWQVPIVRVQHDRHRAGGNRRCLRRGHDGRRQVRHDLDRVGPFCLLGNLQPVQAACGHQASAIQRDVHRRFPIHDSDGGRVERDRAAERRHVSVRSARLIRGLLRSDARERASRNYDVSWRVTGTLPWTDIDPRLEIERDQPDAG